MNFLDMFGIKLTKEEKKTYEKELKVLADDRLYYYKKEKYETIKPNKLGKSKSPNCA